MVERRLPKADVAGSSPVSRSIFSGGIAEIAKDLTKRRVFFRLTL